MSDFEFEHEYDDEDYKSKTAVKQEMKELQKLGQSIVELSDNDFAKIPLEDPLLDAMRQCRKMKHDGARKRQLQYIGKLLRTKADVELIEAALERIREISRGHTRQQQLTEQWRDRLIAEGDTAIGEFAGEYWEADRQHLRQLIRAAQKEQSQQKPPSSSRKLFKYVRELIENQGQP